LFPSPKSKTGHATNIDKAFRRVITEAGLDPAEIVRHTMRNTVITHLVQDGIDFPTVMRISGHRTLAMVQRYAHQNGEHIQDAMDRLEMQLSVCHNYTKTTQSKRKGPRSVSRAFHLFFYF
jgi:site-specific recombinase XerD